VEIDISKLRKENKREFEFDGEVKIDSSKLNFEITRPAKVKLLIKIFSDEVYLKGSFKVEAKLSCVKCLKEYHEVISDEFEAEYLNEDLYVEYTNSHGKDHYYNSKDVVKELLENNIIDVEKVILDYFLLNVTDYPICSPDCKGMDELKSYDNSGMDPRWQQLLNIK